MTAERPVGTVVTSPDDGVPVVYLPFDMAIRVPDGKPGAIFAVLPGDAFGAYTGDDAEQIAEIGKRAWAFHVRRRRPTDKDAPRVRTDTVPATSLARRRYYS